MFNYNWSFKDYPKKKNGYKVFSCFACGGGSTMGYKLAGYDVIGCNEIDKRMMEVYRINHNPKYSYLEDIRIFKERQDLPDELYNLDILDGSPPCSSFSMAGEREDGWGKEKKFKEGQAMQVLDTLFFDFIDVTKKLQPKIVITENVKGLLLGNATNYVNRIYADFDKAGYYVEHYLLNAKDMEVPQKRERVFFMAMRKDMIKKIKHTHTINMFNLTPHIDLIFNYPEIPFKNIYINKTHKQLTDLIKNIWDNRIDTDRKMEDTYMRMKNIPYMYFNYKYIYNNDVVNTVTGNSLNILYNEPRYMNSDEIILASSFPNDYNFNNTKVEYIAAMSVPPVMMAHIATRVKEYWLDKIIPEVK